MIFHGYDASIPPTSPFPKSAAAFGYIGGNTPHVWSLEEWLAATLDGVLRSGPIWVSDFGKGNPEQQARDAVTKAHSLGWTPHAPVLRAIILDSETSEDVSFIREFHRTALVHGFLTVDYRSADAHTAKLSGLPEFVAHYGVPPGPFTDYQWAFQYQADVPWESTKVDLDAFDTELWERLGRGPRRDV